MFSPLRKVVDRLLGPGSKEKIGSAIGGPPPSDVTPRFHALYDRVRKGKSVLPPEAHRHAYLTIEGLFGDPLPFYMDANRKRLRDLGLHVERVPADTEGGIRAGARTIRDAVLAQAAQGRKSVLIGHSKGGVEAAAAIALYPELRPHVRALVAMQAPYGGNPLAQDIWDHRSLTRLADRVLLDGFGARGSLLRELNYDARAEFIRAHPYPTEVPTLCLVSTGGPRLSAGSATGAYLDLRYGEDSDGVVTTADSEIPGTRVVRLDNLNHLDAVFPNLGLRCQPGPLTEVLVALALQEPGPQ